MKMGLLGILLVFFGLFFFYPLILLLGSAFFVETVVDGATVTQFSLDYFRLIVESPFYRECFLNSFIIASWTTVWCLVLALPLAYAFLRLSFPGKTVLSACMLLPLILPPFVGAIGLKQFLARFGSLNLILADLDLVDLTHPPDWFGEGGFVGIIFLEVIHLLPIMFLSVQAALANLDPSLRDAAGNLGARGFFLFRTVTLPLAMPGIFAGSSIVFVSAFTDLGAPLMFDFQITVPTQIFNLVTQPDNPVGAALVVTTLVFVSVLFILGKKLGEGNYAMMARSASYDDTVRLPAWQGWAMTLGISLLILVCILPHLGVVVQSFAYRWFMTSLPTEWSLEFYGEVFALDLTSQSIRNSLFYATCSALLDVILGVAIAYTLARTAFKGRGLLDVVAMLPLAVPGLVLAFAYFMAFTREPFMNTILDTKNYHPALCLILAYAIHRLPYIVRAAYAGFQQLSVSLEEASANMGAGPVQTIVKISLPLISANLIAGTILTFAFAMLDVSSGLLLAQEPAAFPLTKAIYSLMGRVTPTAPSVASALGVLAMLLLAGCLFLASKLLGQKMGQLFKA